MAVLIKMGKNGYPSQRNAPDWNNPKPYKTFLYSKPATEEYRDNWDAIFGRSSKKRKCQ